MNIQIDTDNKIIIINEDVNMGEFVKFALNALPDDWKDYKIVRNDNLSNYEWEHPVFVGDITLELLNTRAVMDSVISTYGVN